MKKPNIVFFFTDDQRFDTIAALGNPDIITPNTDRLVKMGTSFTHAHIPCGTSGAVCMPSRAMLHTGRTLFHLQGEGQSIPQEHTTMGEALQGAGYRTFGTGKWHNGTESFARSFSDGAEIMFGGMGDHWNVLACDFDPSGRYSDRVPMVMNPYASRNISMTPRPNIKHGIHSTELFGQATVDFLRHYESDDPYFIYLSFMAPHDPRTMPERFKKMYDPSKMTIPENYMEEHPHYRSIRDIRDERLAPYPRSPEIVQEHLAEYYGMITHLDDEIGKVMQEVEDRGEMDNTIFIMAGDNGLALGQHGLFGKQNHYDHSVRVPLIFSGPGIPKDTKTDSLAYLLDIFPTLCHLADIPKPESVEGINLLPAMSEPGENGRNELYFAYTDYMRSIRKGPHKLIRCWEEDKLLTELYHLENDPFELHDLSEQEPALVNELLKEMECMAEQWDDRQHPMGQTFWSR